MGRGDAFRSARVPRGLCKNEFLTKGFALEIPPGFGSREPEVRSQKCNGGGVFTGLTEEWLKQSCLGMAGKESNDPNRGHGAAYPMSVRFPRFLRTARRLAALVPLDRRSNPLSRTFGYDRGTKSIARHYIDSFMAAHADDVRGSVLEIGDNTYTARHGSGRVTHSDVLHVAAGSPGSTITGDLTDAATLPPRCYDCIILTQTLQMIYRCETALNHAAGLLAPAGVLLATMSGISQISRYDMDRWGEFWRFTPLSARRLFESAFAPAGISIAAYGNVRSATALLYGRASSELSERELDHRDDDYPVIIAVRAQRRIA